MTPEGSRALFDKYERVLGIRPPRATAEMLEALGIPVRRVAKKKPNAKKSREV